MKWTCRKYNTLLPAHLDRELTEKESASVEKHLERCPRCREQLRQLQASADAMALWEPVAPSSDYDARFWKKIERIRSRPEATPEKPSVIQITRQWLQERTLVTASAAAAIIVCLCSVALFFSNSRNMTAMAPSAENNVDLYLNMDVIAKSDALQHFEVIQLLDVLEQEIDG